MHDQSASRIRSRARAVVSAVCLRALRMTVLKSAGNFTRGECHDLSAEKIQCVNVLSSRSVEFVACQQFSNAGAAGCVRKFQAMVNWRTWRFTFAMSESHSRDAVWALAGNATPPKGPPLKAGRLRCGLDGSAYHF